MLLNCTDIPQNQGFRWVLSLVQTVSPNPILCISGWNLIWITDCPHSISQLFISDLCVHKRAFVFTECAVVSMVMALRCYAYAKNNSNSNTVCNTDVLPAWLRCGIIFRLLKQRQKCSKLSDWLALRNDTSWFLQICSACFLQKHLTCLRFTWREDVKKLR